DYVPFRPRPTLGGLVDRFFEFGGRAGRAQGFELAVWAFDAERGRAGEAELRRFFARHFDLARHPGALAGAVPALDVLDAGGFGDRRQELVVGVRRGLDALVAVEDLEEVPAAVLFAGRQQRRARGLGLFVDDREVAELDRRLARAHLRVDH